MAKFKVGDWVRGIYTSPDDTDGYFGWWHKIVRTKEVGVITEILTEDDDNYDNYDLVVKFSSYDKALGLQLMFNEIEPATKATYGIQSRRSRSRK